jgi:hypothetical protein
MFVITPNQNKAEITTEGSSKLSEYFGTAETIENCIDIENESRKFDIIQLKIRYLSVSCLKCNSIEHNLHWESNSYSARQEIHRLLCNHRYLPLFTRARHSSKSEVLCNTSQQDLYSPWIVRCPYKPEDYLFSAVRDCLFNISAATLHIRRLSPPSATCERAMPRWQKDPLNMVYLKTM